MKCIVQKTMAKAMLSSPIRTNTRIHSRFIIISSESIEPLKSRLEKIRLEI